MKSANVGRFLSRLLKRDDSPTESQLPESVSWETFTLALSEATGKPHYAFSKIPIDADPVDHVVGVARDHVNMLRPKGDMLKYHLRDQRIKPYYAKKDKRTGRWVLFAVVKGAIMEVNVTTMPSLERYLEVFTLREPFVSVKGRLMSTAPVIIMDIYRGDGKFYGRIKRFEINDRPTLADLNQHRKW